MKLVVSPLAVADVEAAVDWYEEQSAGLGAEFESAFMAALRQVEHQPRAYQPQHRELRRVLMRRFPYGVYFRVDDEWIVVEACLHVRRAPRVWMGRGA